MVGLALWARPAHADDRPATAALVRVVLVAPPAALESAVRAALAPWRVVIIIESAAPPRDAADAAVIAERTRASAVAWVAPGWMLIFEPGAAELVVRPADDMDDATAASLALTLKTLLRLPPLPPEPEPEPPAPAPVAVVTRAPPRRPPWRLGAGAGLRVRSAGSEPRLSVTGQRRLGPIALAVGGSLGSGHDIASASFRGTWDETVVRAALLLPLERGRWRLAPGVGVSWHQAALVGEFQGNAGEAVDSADVGLGADAELELTWNLGPLAAGASVTGSFVAFRDRFVTRGSNAVDLSPLEVEVGVVVAASF
jgi:hypothetical protein